MTLFIKEITSLIYIGCPIEYLSVACCQSLEKFQLSASYSLLSGTFSVFIKLKAQWDLLYDSNSYTTCHATRVWQETFLLDWE